MQMLQMANEQRLGVLKCGSAEWLGLYTICRQWHGTQLSGVEQALAAT